jgi:hypothetical protein
MPAFAPTYSHGGNAADGTVAGNGTPIYIGDGTTQSPAMVVICKGGTAVVVMESNGGAVDQGTGLPPSDEWVDCSNGGYALVPNQTLAKVLPVSMPFWRTRIINITGGQVVSYIPGLRTTTGDFTPANRIPTYGTQSFG